MRAQRVNAAKARIESLNPLVTVEAYSTLALLDEANLDTTLQNVDLVCITDSDRETLASGPPDMHESVQCI